jgi:Holliday junction resolvase
MAPSLAALKRLGYAVYRIPGSGSLLKAESADVSLVAEDPLLLLGLAKLFEVRGASWQASDEEVDAWLALEESERTL